MSGVAPLGPRPRAPAAASRFTANDDLAQVVCRNNGLQHNSRAMGSEGASKCDYWRTEVCYSRSLLLVAGRQPVALLAFLILKTTETTCQK